MKKINENMSLILKEMKCKELIILSSGMWRRELR
jgi:hypothetical protein